MHDGWHEQLPDHSREDRKAWVQFGLALIGGGVIFGSLLGVAYGVAHEAIGYWTASEVEAE